MKLSVFVVTYNQEKYIQQCLDSILMQQVNFDYEIIIGEDCSTDNTPQICDEYAQKYPFIHIYHHPKNLGIAKNWEFVLNHCTGDYVAMIEGDDYWIDSNKLQTQVDWLDEHPEYVITSTNIKVVCEEGMNDAEEWFKVRHEGDVSLKEYIFPGICHTSSVVMRNITRNIRYPSYVYITDTYTFLLVAQQGQAYHFDQKMSVYRRHTNNTTVNDKYNDILSTIKWANQHRKMQKKFPQLKCLLRYYEEKELATLAGISRKIAPKQLWKYRIRYMMMHKQLLLSSFCIRTILYLPLFLSFSKKI